MSLGLSSDDDMLDFIYQTTRSRPIRTSQFFHYQVDKRDIRQSLSMNEHFRRGSLKVDEKFPGYIGPAAFLPPSSFVTAMFEPKGVVIRTEPGRIAARRELKVKHGMISVGPKPEYQVFVIESDQDSHFLTELTDDLETVRRTQLYPEPFNKAPYAPSMPPIALEDGRVLVVSNSGVQCFGPADPQRALEWYVPLPDVGPGRGTRVNRDDFASVRPEVTWAPTGNALAVVDGQNRIFVKTGHYFFCIDIEGKILWSIKHDGPDELTTNPLITVDGRVFVGSERQLLEVVPQGR